MSNAKPADAEYYATSDMLRPDLASLITTRQAAVKKIADAKVAVIDNKRSEMQQKQRDYTSGKQRESNDMLNSGMVNNKSYTKEDISTYREYTAPRTSEITLATGATMKVSKLQKVRYEMSTAAQLQESMDIVLMHSNGVDLGEINKGIEDKKVTGNIAQRLAASTKKKNTIKIPVKPVVEQVIKDEDRIELRTK